MGGVLAATSQQPPALIKLFPEAWQPSRRSGEMTDPAFWPPGEGAPAGFELAMTVFHELFHLPTLFATPLNDEGGLDSYGLDDAQRLDRIARLWNVENYVWYAFLVVRRGTLFLEPCTVYPPSPPQIQTNTFLKRSPVQPPSVGSPALVPGGVPPPAAAGGQQPSGPSTSTSQDLTSSHGPNSRAQPNPNGGWSPLQPVPESEAAVDEKTCGRVTIKEVNPLVAANSKA
ncbi:hypothetical protein HGRIS_007233 [Hohenbuehelia grisea]|uniref:Uncharacterized protein n=1 Tax=Hohenbuehelia grisea TaxID=104357 RepID=A0ABR3JBV9_9AGAR